MTFPILTAKQAHNAEVFTDILMMYVPHESLVADVTFGRGRFWRGRSNLENEEREYFMTSLRPDITLIGSDIAPVFTGLVCADFRELPYRDEIFDTVVFDPPFGNASTTPRLDWTADRYNLQTGTSIQRIKGLYTLGILECARILRPAGILIVKCQDMVNCGKQQWFHLEIKKKADLIGLTAEDLFVIVQKGRPIMRHKHQIHARKNHSYFWVFRKK